MPDLSKTQHRTLLLAIDLLTQAQSHIEGVHAELQSDFDLLDDDAQTTPAGEALSDTIGQLEDALSELENCISNIPSTEEGEAL